MDYTALKSELTSDPLGLGYAALTTAGNDSGLAALLNSATGPGAATVNMTSVPKSDMLLGLLPAVMAIAGLDAAAQSQWDRVLGVIQSVDAVDVSSPSVQAIFASAVAANLLTDAQVAVITSRTGSRAEFLFGTGTVVSSDDIATALRGDA